MTTTTRRRERQEWNPDLGVLASRLLFSLQEELFEELAEAGYDDLHPRHGAVLAYLDEDGIRATELARLSGRHKQIVGRLVDELEELGYVDRRPDPADRRAKLVVPTGRGLGQMRGGGGGGAGERGGGGGRRAAYRGAPPGGGVGEKTWADCGHAFRGGPPRPAPPGGA